MKGPVIEEVDVLPPGGDRARTLEGLELADQTGRENLVLNLSYRKSDLGGILVENFLFMEGRTKEKIYGIEGGLHYAVDDRLRLGGTFTLQEGTGKNSEIGDSIALNGLDDVAVSRRQQSHLELPEGKIIVFYGPNGSGKSTALRVMRGLHGVMFRHGRDRGKPVASWLKNDLAREIAMLGRFPSAPDALTVQEPVFGPFAVDHKAFDKALDATEITHLADHPIGNLSRGQSQRA